MATTRFFITNLPASTKERDLSNLFQDYGQVQRVEIKTKENVLEDNTKIIAFVTLEIYEGDVEYCLNELNWQKVNGAKIKVSVAKESFLERLKREREENAAAATGSLEKPAVPVEESSWELSRNVVNTRKKFSEDANEDDDDIPPELLITRKRAASSMHNGKIVIQNFETSPLHVIEKHKKPAKNTDSKISSAEQKRQQSLNEKKNQYQEKKSAIQQSLSGLDGKKSNKLRFTDSDDEDTNSKPKKSKTDIFDGKDDEDDMSFDLKPEIYGKKGEKLLQMQIQQSLDARFRIDAKFIDDDEDDETAADSKSNGKVDELDNERSWQMGILEQVVGHKMDTGSTAQKATQNKRMLRFDPAKHDHQKFLRPKETETASEAQSGNLSKKQKKNQQQANDESEKDATSTPEVSKEVFYVVTDTLAQSLKTRGAGFSLLNLFGNGDVTDSLVQREDQLKKMSNDKILINKMEKNTLNPFSYDSSSESETEEPAVSNAETNSNTKTKQSKKVAITMETFFIQSADERLKEGANFFKPTSQPDESAENYDEMREKLKFLIKTKITKTKKKFKAGHKNRK